MTNAVDGLKVTNAEGVNHMRIYDYQITPLSEIQVGTAARERFMLRQLHRDLLNLVIGDKTVIKEEANWLGETGVILGDSNGDEEFLALDGSHLVVTDASEKRFIGHCGRLFRGFGIGKGFELYGDQGMTSANVTSLKANGILPDLITRRALEIVREYSGVFGIGEALMNDLSQTKQMAGNHPFLIMLSESSSANDQHTDPATVQAKVSEMIRGIICTVKETGTLPVKASEISHIQNTFSRLLASQCYHPHGGMTRFFSRDIWLNEGKNRQPTGYNVYSLIDLEGNAQAFSVKPLADR